MKRAIVMMLGTALLVSSCSSYTATGASVGGEFGHLVGATIGGINGGWRGERMGSLIGTMGGVIAGAAIGTAVEKSQQHRYDPVEEPVARNERYDDHDIGMNRRNREFHVKSDRYDNNTEGVRSISVDDLSRRPAIELRNARIYDTNNDGVLSRGEQCTVVFEVMNNTSSPIYDIYPFVEDATGNTHVKVSQNLRVESIAPHQGIRYTASIVADKRLKDGEIIVRLGVVRGQQEITSQTQQFKVTTRKKALASMPVENHKDATSYDW